MSNFREILLNGSRMAVRKKIQTFKNTNISYIALNHVVWRLRMWNNFHEIFKFRDFMNTLRNFSKSVFAHIFVKFKYFGKQFILAESPDHVL